ncbi:MAG: hypothetical protein II309_08240 [Bacilli bacterium]|nr:hypothetical protein [Bacilli bacterium]
MEKFKQVLEVLKQLWAVKSLRAIMIIFAYMIFFSFVIAGIRVNYNYNSKTPELDINSEDTFENKKNYEAMFKINNEQYKFINKNEKDYLIVNDTYYRAELNVLTPINVETGEIIFAEIPNFEVKFWLFTPSVISNLLKKATLEYKTEFTNKDIKKGYIVDMKDVFDNVNSGKTILENKTIDNNNIKMEILERDSKIVSLILDLTNYYQLFVESDLEYKVEIEY